MRKKLNNDFWLDVFMVGCVIAGAIALCATVYNMSNLKRGAWAPEKARMSHTEAVERVLIPETPVLSPGLERVQ